jgi:hypothetical protein
MFTPGVMLFEVKARYFMKSAQTCIKRVANLHTLFSQKPGYVAVEQ